MSIRFAYLWMLGAVLLAPMSFGKGDFAAALLAGVGAGLVCAVVCSPLLFFGKGDAKQRTSRGMLAVGILAILLWAVFLVRQ